VHLIKNSYTVLICLIFNHSQIKKLLTSTESKGITIKSISFSFFWKYIAKQMGSVRIKINENASSINDFIHPDSDSIKEIIRTSYTRSQCYHLDSEVNVNDVLDILC